MFGGGLGGGLAVPSTRNPLYAGPKLGDGVGTMRRPGFRQRSPVLLGRRRQGLGRKAGENCPHLPNPVRTGR